MHGRSWTRGIRITHTGLVFGACALACLATEARAEWQKVTTEQGIEVFEQPVDGRNVPMFRGTGEVEASLEQTLEVLTDVSQHTRWMPDCAETRVLHEDDDGSLVVYRRSAAPWPVSDRDVIVRSRTEVVAPGVEVHVYFENVNDPALVPDSGAVRMPHLVGHYKIRAIAPRRTRVEYQVDVDPGGRLPGWMAATTSRTNPIRTLVGLRAQLATLGIAPVGAAER